MFHGDSLESEKGAADQLHGNADGLLHMRQRLRMGKGGCAQTELFQRAGGGPAGGRPIFSGLAPASPREMAMSTKASMT